MLYYLVAVNYKGAFCYLIDFGRPAKGYNLMLWRFVALMYEPIATGPSNEAISRGAQYRYQWHGARCVAST